MDCSDDLTIAIAHHQAGRLMMAEQIYRKILEADPNHADAIHLLGVIAHQVGKHEMSVEYINRAIELNGDAAHARCNLGMAYHSLARYAEAIACYRRALELKHDDVETHLNLGVALKAQGNLLEAIACYYKALELDPNCVQALNNIGIELKDQGKFEEAILIYQRAIKLRPDFAEVHNNLGNVYKEQGRLDEAITCYRKAIELNPDYADAFNNLGNPLKDQGKLDEAVACFRRAIELKPDFAITHSNLVYTLMFCPDMDGASLLKELRSWNAKHAAPLAASIQPHLNNRSTDRRLKIGYVSADFRDHCQSFFTVPLFSSHDRAHFEIYCYSDVTRPDPIMDRVRSLVDVWRPIYGVDHSNVSRMIREDGIDILVDLSMHMAQNRLPVFARKPAPVQVCWLAYPGSTGVSVIDYRITDVHLDPPGLNDHQYSEASIRLPQTFWCYDPLEHETTVNELPSLTNGYITFGCLNNFCKVNADLLRIWAQVLNRVDGSRLMILAGEGSHRARALEQFEAEGVARDRVTFVPPKPRPQYLKQYNEIDIGLDTVPYNGHTTSLDSFWMGVPVVTLVGSTVVGRAGLCQLMNLGLPELIANDSKQFLNIVVELTTNPKRLSELRASLRDRMRVSPLMDAPLFARNIENAFRQIWREWCLR